MSTLPGVLRRVLPHGLAAGLTQRFFMRIVKKLVYILGLLALLASTGCVIRDDHRGGYYDHEHWEHGHGEDHWDRY